MDIACPNCAATYRVPDSLLARGAALRCAGCDHSWVPDVPQSLAAAPAPLEERAAPPAPAEPPFLEAEPAAPPPPEPTPPEPAPAATFAEAPRPARSISPTMPPPLQRRAGPRQMRAMPEHAAAGGRAWALPLAWAASVTLVVLVLAGLVVFGEAIAQAWPPFARVTSLLSG